ncbi:MAG: hypothetical protein RI947_442 [Candidatus Parcubacteria bacterium]|jgi:NRAMP (natural resistance-associated macrophage protein)-like metal ion transporter
MAGNLVKKIAETPAVALEKALEETHWVAGKLQKNESVKKATRYFETLGPGLVTGAADDDPSGIATYSQTGAQYGYQLLWLSIVTFPLMSIVQEMCARIALQTGRGLAANIRLHFPRWVLYTCTTLLFVANILNLGADLGAMAEATKLIAPQLNVSFLVVLFTVISLLVQIFVPYKQYSKYLKLLVIALFAYVLSAFSIKLNWMEVLEKTLIPSLVFTKDQIILICGILGTTISPYLFFWQTATEIEEEIVQGKTTIKMRSNIEDAHISEMRTDVWTGMFVSNLIMFFIIVATAATLHANGIYEITSAADAARALKPFAGDLTYVLFTLGIVGTGLLAVPILAGSASYAIAESFKWKEGLYRKLKDAPSFYGIIIIAMLIGLMINFIGMDPIKALIYSAVLNGIVAPVILALIVLISSSKKIMANRANHPVVTLIGWFITAVMTVAGIFAIGSFFI